MVETGAEFLPLLNPGPPFKKNKKALSRFRKYRQFEGGENVHLSYFPVVSIFIIGLKR